MAAKAKALFVPTTLTDFIEYLRELVVNGARIKKIDDQLQKRLDRLEGMKKRLKEAAAREKAPHEDRIRLLFAAIRTYFMKRKADLLEGEKKSWSCEYATVGLRLVGPAIVWKAKTAEIIDAIIDLGWVKRFCTLALSKRKMHADLERTRQIPGVEVQEQRDEFFVAIPDGAFEFVRGKLRRQAEEDEDEAA